MKLVRTIEGSVPQEHHVMLDKCNERVLARLLVLDGHRVQNEEGEVIQLFHFLKKS